MLSMVSTSQVVDLWEQLMQCLYDDNKYGGRVAEIYIYTMMPHSPAVCMNPTSTWAKEEYFEACQRLHALCVAFAERFEVVVQFEGGESIDYLIADPLDPFTHRVHLEVVAK